MSLEDYVGSCTLHPTIDDSGFFYVARDVNFNQKDTGNLIGIYSGSEGGLGQLLLHQDDVVLSPVELLSAPSEQKMEMEYVGMSNRFVPLTISQGDTVLYRRRDTLAKQPLALISSELMGTDYLSGPLAGSYFTLLGSLTEHRVQTIGQLETVDTKSFDSYIATLPGSMQGNNFRKIVASRTGIVIGSRYSPQNGIALQQIVDKKPTVVAPPPAPTPARSSRTRRSGRGKKSGKRGSSTPSRSTTTAMAPAGGAPAIDYLDELACKRGVDHDSLLPKRN